MTTMGSKLKSPYSAYEHMDGQTELRTNGHTDGRTNPLMKIKRRIVIWNKMITKKHGINIFKPDVLPEDVCQTNYSES